MAQSGDVYRLDRQFADHLLHRNGKRCDAPGNALFSAAINGWLWVTGCSLISPGALSERNRSKAQANGLKGEKNCLCRKLVDEIWRCGGQSSADQLRKGDIVLVEAGDIIPCDSEVIEGAHRSMKAHRGIGTGDP